MFTKAELALMDRALESFIQDPSWITGCNETDESAAVALQHKLRRVIAHDAPVHDAPA